VVFCCTANQIRSPFAEAVVNQLNMKPKWLGSATVESCGVLAQPGLSAMADAVKAAQKLGVDLTAHRSRNASELDLDDAWVIGFVPGHRVGCKKFSLLGEFLDLAEIPDPVGQSFDIHLGIYDQILAALRCWSQLPLPT